MVRKVLNRLTKRSVSAVGAAVVAMVVSSQAMAASVDYSGSDSTTTATGSLLAASVDASSPAAVLSLSGLTSPVSLTGGSTTNVATAGQAGDNNPDIIYDPATGDIKISPDGVNGINSIVLQSVAGIFTGSPPTFPGSSFFTTDSDKEVSQTFFQPAMTNAPFDMGNIAQTGLSQSFLLGDLTMTGGSTGASNFQFTLITPEPASIGLLGIGAVGLLIRRRRA